jgi:hypothetical protein
VLRQLAGESGQHVVVEFLTWLTVRFHEFLGLGSRKE